MKDVINWLINIEYLAARIYKEAAAKYPDDKEFADFLNHLAKDEEYHCHIVKMAYEYISGREERHFIISMDDDTKKRLELPLNKCHESIKEGKAGKQDIIGNIVSVEFSEWNHIFVYAVDSLKQYSAEFIPVAAKIQQHKRYIERFVQSRPEFGKFIEKIRHIPKAWEERLLVVDDSEAIVELLKTILSEEGTVEGAADGEEAIKKVGEKYFAAIITDVDMPHMGGIEFYNMAVKKYPNIWDRIIFFTCFDDKDHISFFKKNNLKYLIKPSPINEIKKAVISIMNR